MKLPHREKAHVPIAKIRDYQLVETHPDGWSKAKLLRRLGHDERTMDVLIANLLNIANVLSHWIEGKMIQELDIISLTHDIPEENLKEGKTGTVVHCHRGGEAFEVEFTDFDGTTIAVLTLTQHDVKFNQRPTPQIG
jgi:uncharacterized protein DUF4926/uncharacterized protein DUF6883